MININRWPNLADSAFAIRDDDLSYFAKAKMIDLLYKYAWDLGFKVSFATIPMIKGTNNLNVPPYYRKSDKYYLISDNIELINYTKRKLSEGKIDILQHGYAHSENTNLPEMRFCLENGSLCGFSDNLNLYQYSEFFGLNAFDTNYKVKFGKEILEKAYNIPIKTFVAPQEYFTKNLFISLIKNNLYCCGNVGLKNYKLFPFSMLKWHSIFSIFIDKIFKNFYIFRTKNFNLIVISPNYRHYWNKNLNIVGSEQNYHLFKENFQKVIDNQGYLILLTHFWEYYYDWMDDPSQLFQLEYLNKILDFVNSCPYTWKCTVTEILEWINAKNSLIINRKVDGFEIYSPNMINGLSIEIPQNKKDNLDYAILEKEHKFYIILNFNAGETIRVKW
jgi:hypothetical protein